MILFVVTKTRQHEEARPHGKEAAIKKLKSGRILL